jgi:hypothetical protein
LRTVVRGFRVVGDAARAPFEPSPFATTPVGSFGRPACRRSLLDDVGGVPGRVVRSEDGWLRREVARRHALGCLVDHDQLLARLQVRPVEGGPELLDVAPGEAIEPQWSPRWMCGLHSGIVLVPMRGDGNRFVMSAPVRFSSARAQATWWTPPRTSRQPLGTRAAGWSTVPLGAQLPAAGAGVEEVVVREVLDQIAGAEDVVAGPRRQRAEGPARS